MKKFLKIALVSLLCLVVVFSVSGAAAAVNLTRTMPTPVNVFNLETGYTSTELIPYFTVVVVMNDLYENGHVVGAKYSRHYINAQPAGYLPVMVDPQVTTQLTLRYNNTAQNRLYLSAFVRMAAAGVRPNASKATSVTQYPQYNYGPVNGHMEKTNFYATGQIIQ